MTAYSERARKLLQEKNATYDYLTAEQKEEHNRLAKKAFAKGIKDIKLKDRMLTRDATSLEDAIAYAIESENEKSFQISQNELFCRFCRMNGHREAECRRKNPNTDGINTLISVLQSIGSNRPNFRNNRDSFNPFNRPNPNWFNRFQDNNRFQNNNRFQDTNRFQDNNRFNNRGFGNNRFNNFNNNANNNLDNNENFQSNVNRNNNNRFQNQNRNNSNQFQRANQPNPRQENQMNAVEPEEKSEN